MFIETEATPNPATLKFLPGQPVLISSSARDFRDRDAAEIASPLAARLFEVEGVSGVFLGADFISVTKNDGEWGHLKPAVLGAIMEHFLSGAPAVNDEAASESAEGRYSPEDAEIVGTIIELIDTRVRPAVAQDGGDIVFQGYRDGIVYLHMRGACAGCPSSTATLRNGVENLLRHYVPEVREVRQI